MKTLYAFLSAALLIVSGFFIRTKTQEHQSALKALEFPTYEEQSAAKENREMEKNKKAWDHAETAATEWLSRTTTGFRRVKRFWLEDTHMKDAANWSAGADVEFINKVGGVEVVTEYLKFQRLSSGEISASTDYQHKR